MRADRPHEEPGAPDRDAVGLCARCSYAIVQESARGNTFWRCGAAEEREGLVRYPPLPVRTCPAHEPGGPRAAGA